jgi:hypothetical protein
MALRAFSMSFSLLISSQIRKIISSTPTKLRKPSVESEHLFINSQSPPKAPPPKPQSLPRWHQHPISTPPPPHPPSTVTTPMMQVRPLPKPSASSPASSSAPSLSSSASLMESQVQRQLQRRETRARTACLYVEHRGFPW